MAARPWWRGVGGGKFAVVPVWVVVVVASGCAAPGPLTAPSIAGRWNCESYGELIVFDQAHYALSTTDESGHFRLAFDDHEIIFEPDGPLAGEIGRWDPPSEQLEIGPSTDAATCTLAGPAPSIPVPGH